MKTRGQRTRRSASATAAPPRFGPSDEERIRWLLNLLRNDVMTLSAGDVLASRNEVFRYLHDEQAATVNDWDDTDLRAHGPVPPRRTDITSQQVIAAARDLMAGLQAELRAGLEGLQHVGSWQPFARGTQAPSWSLERRVDGTVRRAYLGTWRIITLASAADLFLPWWPRLRRCPSPACGAWFLPTHGRQRYHDERCAAKARYARFKPTRNYKAEYAHRHDSTRTAARRRSLRRKT